MARFAVFAAACAAAAAACAAAAAILKAEMCEIYTEAPSQDSTTALLLLLRVCLCRQLGDSNDQDESPSHNLMRAQLPHTNRLVQ
eukprot:1968262-Rhodomonas_salina.1